jgi:hypothetical protein
VPSAERKKSSIVTLIKNQTKSAGVKSNFSNPIKNRLNKIK